MARKKVVFLDTTYLLPLFQIPLKIKGFTKEIFEKKLVKFELIYTSEVSIEEIISKVTKLYFRKEVPKDIFKVLKENLSVLREDEKFIIKPLTASDLKSYEKLVELAPKLNSIDRIILSQAVDADILLTEDKDIISLANDEEFQREFRVRALNWINFNKLF